MQKIINNNKYNLPELCFTVTPEGDLVCISYDLPGYCISIYNTDSIETNHETADYLNKKLQVSKSQQQAMLYGSMFGWEKPGCNPKLYENNSLKEKVLIASKFKKHYQKDHPNKQKYKKQISL